MTDPAIIQSLADQYARAKVLPQHETELTGIVAHIMGARARYEAVASILKLPWFIVAAIHWLEASGNFKTYLHNGDPLFNSDGKPIPTVHVPAGRGPFNPQNWETGAVDALGGYHGQLAVNSSIGASLELLQRYNGMGYAHRGIPSPYLWSFTDQYQKGKFVSDGVFSPDAVSKEPGAAAIWLTMGIPA